MPATWPVRLEISSAGLFAPANAPTAIVRKVNADANSALQAPDLISALAQQGAQPAGGTPQDFEKFMQAEIAKWRHVINKAKIPLAN